MTSAEHPGDLEAELRALGDSLAIPSPPPDQVAATVRARLTLPGDHPSSPAAPLPENAPPDEEPRPAAPSPQEGRPSPVGGSVPPEKGRASGGGEPPPAAPSPQEGRPSTPGRVPSGGGRSVRGRRTGRRRWVVVAVVAVVVAVCAATPQGREVVVAVLRQAGIELRLGSEPPEPVRTTATPPGERTVPPGDVRTGYPRALGAPERVTTADDGRVVSMFWPGGIRFDRIDGTVDPYFFKKLAPPFPEHVEVNGVTGWWVAGEHPLGHLTRDDGEEIPLRQAAATLVWQAGGTGYRLEGAGSMERAVELARSLG
ncbi:hypothetical protein [Nonomuraea sp. NPDC049725]|uniref:hypothetical protein n=1 Tax=Nonomuraea sp. NPDC049725 TaxID=3154508 RepID=UPI003447F6AC